MAAASALKERRLADLQNYSLIMEGSGRRKWQLNAEITANVCIDFIDALIAQR